MPALYSRPERLGLSAILGLVVVFGCVVELRSAFLKRPMTDLGVYLRAAWSVRAGADLYAVTDDNGWHYHYPPLLAIMLAPLADPPVEEDHTCALPFAVSVALWYAFSICCLAGTGHMLATALEESSNARLPWWVLRVVPMLVCLPPIGHSLMRGQVNLLLLFLLSGMAAASLRQQSWRAGIYLAGAICLKIFPVFLVIFLVWRRDGRALVACTIGLLVGLLLIPAVVLGPARTRESFDRWQQALLRPALAVGVDRSRAKELIDVTATDSQSYLAVIHNTLFPQRALRPDQALPAVRWAHWLTGGALTLITLGVAGWRRNATQETELIFFGLLIVMMLLLSPVCHLHYFCLTLPLVSGFLQHLWNSTADFRLPGRWRWCLVLYGTANFLPHLPRLEFLRDYGLAMWAALALWLAGLIILWQRHRICSRETHPLTGRRRPGRVIPLGVLLPRASPAA